MSSAPRRIAESVTASSGSEVAAAMNNVPTKDAFQPWSPAMSPPTNGSQVPAPTTTAAASEKRATACPSVRCGYRSAASSAYAASCFFS